MKVTDKTKLSELAAFLPYLEQSSIKSIKDAAEAKFGSPWGVTIGQFFTYSEGDYSAIGVDFGRPLEVTVFQYYWMESFKEMTMQLQRTIESLTVQPTPEAKEASVGCRKMSFQESVKVFCRAYFGLHSFAEVDALTLDDFLLAKKDAYNKDIFDKTLAEIHKRNSHNT